MSKSKLQIATEHLEKAQAEAASGDLSDAIQWGFASLEAAIDALAQPRGISTDQKHWRRRDAATQLHADGVLANDLGPLHDKLNEIRKGVFYDGEEPDLEGEDITDVLAEIEKAVATAREEGNE